MILYIFLFISKLNALEVYSFNDCVDQVIKNNAEIEIARAGLRSSDYDLKSKRSGFVPRLSASFSKSVDKTTILEPSPLQLGTDLSSTQSSLSASLNASLNLFGGFKDINSYEQTFFLKQSSEENYAQVKASLSAELKISFENLLYAKEFKNLTYEIIKRREENLRLVELRYQGGLENKGSVLLSKAYLEQAKYDDLQAENAINIAKARLAKVMGRDGDTKFDIKDSSLTSNFKIDEKPDFNEIALATPNYRRSESRVKAAEKAIAVAKSNFYPSIDLTGSLRRNGRDFFPGEREGASFGIVLSIPLFDGGRDYYAHKTSVESWVGVESERLSLRRDLILKLEQNYSNLREAYSRFKVDESFKNAVTVRADISRSKYNNGLLTFENWDIIENDLIARQKSYLITKRDVVSAEASWEEIRGISILP